MKRLICYLLVSLLFLIPSISKADFSNITHPLEGRYRLLGESTFGDKFKVTVRFDLWEDLGTGLYQYRYRVRNNVDASGSFLNRLDIKHDGPILSYNLGTGWFSPDRFEDNGSLASFKWRPINSVPSGWSTPWFCFTSYGAPKIYSAYGDGIFPRAKALGNLPAPAPEPFTIVLLIIGFLLAGIVVRGVFIPEKIK